LSSHVKILFCSVVICLFFSSHCIYAQDLGYDKYGYDVTTEDSTHAGSTTKNTFNAILDSPAYSIRFIKEILKKGVVWLEDYHVYDKTMHIYDTITDMGIYPYRQSIGDRHEDPPGIESSYGLYPSKRVTSSKHPLKLANVQYIKEFELEKGLFSQIQTRSWMQYAPLRYKDYGGQLILNDFAGENNYVKTTVRYHDNPQEDFFGEGPNTSLGSGAAFGIEEFSASLGLGHEFLSGWTVEGGVTFSTSDISDAKDNKKAPINAFSNLQGLSGANIVGLGVSVEHDTRDNPLNPRRGGFQRVKLGYYEGVNGDDFGYTKTRVDIAEYLPIGELFNIFYYDSVLAFRIAGEFNDDINGDKIPFFDKARLGGGESLRAYQYNRFFDENSLLYSVEYRYNIWGIKNYKADATVFFDIGWVFDEFSEFEIGKYRESYGIGFRVLMPHFTLALEGAHGDEGTEVYLKMNPNF